MNWVVLFAVLVYGFIHSLLASLQAKDKARRWFGPAADRWYRLAYNVFAVISLLPVLALPAFLPDSRVYTIPAPWIYLSLAGQLVAVGMLAVGLLHTGVWSFLGIRQLMKPNPTGPPQLIISGLYRWVRHPLYTAGLLLIWLTPVMTTNLLALNTGFTVYIIVGAMFEERKLRREFGKAYRQYQERTPMLIPGLRGRR